jgi:hypothetical protein
VELLWSVKEVHEERSLERAADGVKNDKPDQLGRSQAVMIGRQVRHTGRVN